MKNAFSLIELMVVIAIVAVLAAVAVPAYKNYINKAKLSTALLFVDSNVDSSIRYYNAHGVFANAEQLGLPFDPGNHNTAVTPDGTFLAPGVGQITFGDSANNVGYDPSQCRYGSAVAAILAGATEDFDPGNPTGDFDFVTLFKYFIDVDGVVIKRCNYTYNRVIDGDFGAATPLTGNYIANCSNNSDDGSSYTAETTNIIDTACN